MSDRGELDRAVLDARQRTLALVADLGDEQLRGPRLAIVNPLLWEIGHVAWFQELWVLRHALGEAPIRADGDALWDSSAVAHDTRWDLPLPPRPQTLRYMAEVCDRVRDRLGRQELPAALAYFARYTTFHEDMHDEAFMYTRQTLGYGAPALSGHSESGGTSQAGAWRGDARVPGGPCVLGAREDEPFVFDNEKWAHPVMLAPFTIARAAVSQSEFAEFVEDQGYVRRQLWSDAGWRWREGASAEQPLYWRRAGRGWERHDFDRWVPLEPHRPVVHVGWFEAEAYCAWARRRLPTEAEWEAAAAGQPDASGRSLSPRKRRFPWGDEPPTRDRANLDGLALGCVDVAERSAGDSAFGCRQMIGNVWEWTASDFVPYPRFTADAYRDYSQPWFGTHKVLRGGGWVTRARLIRNTWRNFYTPDRRDVWAGFRTCSAG